MIYLGDLSSIYIQIGFRKGGLSIKFPHVRPSMMTIIISGITRVSVYFTISRNRRVWNSCL